MIVVIDYGMGNLRSVLKAFERLSVDVIVSSAKDEINKASKIVLPGVGHFERGVQRLYNLDLVEILNRKVINENIPVLGICLGMQLMTNFSEEGSGNGLSWIDAKTVRFNFHNNYIKVPHTGWNNIIEKKDHSILNGLNNMNLYYFTHSYYVVCNSSEDILTTTSYGVDFVSSFQKENIIGMQFHPEKSHEAGLQILKNFAEH